MSASDKGCVGPVGPSPWPRLGLWRCLLLLAALDAAAWGLVGWVRPALLFDRLGVEPRNDLWAWELLVKRGDPPEGIQPPRDAGLWQLLSFLSLAQAAFLALAAWRPRTLGGLAIVPLIGHALGTILWLWSLGTVSSFPANRIPFSAPGVLAALAVHNEIWLVLLVAFLLVWRRRAGVSSRNVARLGRHVLMGRPPRRTGFPRTGRAGRVRAASPQPRRGVPPCPDGPSSP